MSRNIDLSDHATRREMAEKVRTLRTDRGLSQAELGELVGISRQSITEIERGTKVPRAKTLRRILEVLGVEVEGVSFDMETERWLVMFGTLIEAIPTTKRADAVNLALGTLASEVGSKQDLNVSGMTDDELAQLDPTKFDLAATRDTSSVEEQTAPNYEDESQDTPEA